MWGRTYINLPNFLLNFLLKYAFVLDVIWNTWKSVSSYPNTSKATLIFQHTPRCLDMWWNTLSHVSYITSNICQKERWQTALTQNRHVHSMLQQYIIILPIFHICTDWVKLTNNTFLVIYFQVENVGKSALHVMRLTFRILWLY